MVMDHQISLQLFDSSLVPFESKDDSLHPAPLAIVQLDLQLLEVEVEEESELGLVQVYDLGSHKEYFQKTFQKLTVVTCLCGLRRLNAR